ncbi:MAG: GNAT family N-acetyltransferase [Pyrinomonadaceae bacterium]|nr:GNAT family N-acetyltransferase [Pyrinomonadaceae bacterium]
MLKAANDPIIIRDIHHVSEIRLVEQLEKEVWGLNDLDVVPMMQLVATIHAGGHLIGAFDRDELVGFAYGFVGLERGVTIHHSHMLAVKQTYRNRDLGRRLKLAQRERALRQSITRMTWTFDPLQSLNAHFNFSKLGVLADTYIINFYGETTPSFLHRNGTDRLWVNWPLDSQRVKDRIERGARDKDSFFDLKNIAPLVQLGADSEPRRNESTAAFDEEQILIEIPTNIIELEQTRLSLAREWREATRVAFTKALAAGYIVTEFYLSTRGEQRYGAYLLDARQRVEGA